MWRLWRFSVFWPGELPENELWSSVLCELLANEIANVNICNNNCDCDESTAHSTDSHRILQLTTMLSLSTGNSWGGTNQLDRNQPTRWGLPAVSIYHSRSVCTKFGPHKRPGHPKKYCELLGEKIVNIYFWSRIWCSDSFAGSNTWTRSWRS